MTEYAVDDEKYMSPLAPELREVGVLVEPLTIAEKAFKQVWDVQDRLPWFDPSAPEKTRGGGHRAIVFGGGPVGLLGAMALVNRGFETWVYSLEKAPHPKVDVTNAIGAHWVSAAEHDMEALAKQVGNIDVVYEATGASKLSFDLLKYLGVNGVFIFTGVPGHKPPAPIDTDLIMRNMVLKNQLLVGTVNANKEAFDAASRDLAEFNKKWTSALKMIITERHPIDKAPALLTGASPAGIKNVITLR
jgi:threonine dehydrogenase-like Zn-dependent dehydrogenase